MIIDSDIGRIEVSTLALPDFVKDVTATYLFSGKVLVSYQHAEDSPEAEVTHIAVINDDGSGFRDIFTGEIPVHQKANGIRYMPFADNTRVLLGDYILECVPNIDDCEKAELIPVVYPWNIREKPQVFMSWSEVIISPDNEHVCWTSLLSGMAAAVVAIGYLEREARQYTVKDARIISDHNMLAPDPLRPGYSIALPLRGGEVKQFVRGGTAISVAGSGGAALTASVVQDLISPRLERITYAPGYEETTIFSPDEKLGLVMSTRGSEKTNCAILGLLPRPNANLVTGGLINTVYLYAVAGVRYYRPGNIGPVLIEIEKSIGNRDYMGTVLCDPEEQWVYCSPMSWHPDGKWVMWPEILRGTRERRMRIAALLDYVPKPPVAAKQTPNDIPYATTDILSFQVPKEPAANIMIAGKASGELIHDRTADYSKSIYREYSDDGVTFFNGTEETRRGSGEVVYEADIKMTGSKHGVMACRITFADNGITAPAGLLRDKSYGYAEYDGLRLSVEDMAD